MLLSSRGTNNDKLIRKKVWKTIGGTKLVIKRKNDEVSINRRKMRRERMILTINIES